MLCLMLDCVSIYHELSLLYILRDFETDLNNKPMSTTVAHFDELEFLIQSEQEYEREKFRLLQSETPLQQRCLQGSSLYPLQVRQLDYGLGGRPILTLETRADARLNAFQPGQTVSLFCLANQSDERTSAVVRRIWQQELQIFLHSNEVPEWLEDGKLGLDAYYDETTYREMLRAVQILKNPEQARLRKLREVLLGAEPARFLQAATPAISAGFNDSQNEALNQVLQAQDLALIHGPPGTGKTTTLVACVQAVVSHEKQVLVCAASNTAVDLLVRKLAAQGLSVLRLGHPARMQEDIWPYTLDSRLEQHPNAQVLKDMRREMLALQRQARRYRRSFGPAERAERREQYAQARALREQIQALEQQMTQTLISQTQVIACTFVGATQQALRPLRFETVFIDEAAQALEGACWIPILKANRVIMAGDHCQLPPTIHNPQAQKLAMTLFEQCMQHQPQAGVLLRTQYRMHQQIMAFSNAWFYGGQLLADASVATHVLNPAAGPDAEVNTPRLWIDTAGCGFEEAQNPESKSFANPEEGHLLRRWLQAHLNSADFPAEPVSIGVIAPYREQVQWLKNHLKLDLPAQVSLEIETVDSFQGQERDLICISLVRSNEMGEIGFLKDLRRMNVAMTRARKQLVMVGDSATLGHHPFYRQLLEHTENEGTWRSAWELMYDE